MFYGLMLIALSILAVPSLLLSKKPDAAETLEKIAPYQGWIGLVFCLAGVWGIIQAVLNMSILSAYPIWWITWLAGSVVQAVLGFMLGYNLIDKYILSKNDSAAEKGVEMRNKLASMQGNVGMFGIAVGIWMIVASFMFYV